VHERELEQPGREIRFEHSLNGREVQVGPYKVDALIPGVDGEKPTILEFQGWPSNYRLCAAL